MKGTVIKLFADKGYGFIRGSDGVNRFFHASFVEKKQFDTLQAHDAEAGVTGTPVEFDPTETERGQQAHKVQPLR